ncbi:MAG: hypothetical protein U0599_11745 [Vicinamibacteria bacterium]
MGHDDQVQGREDDPQLGAAEAAPRDLEAADRVRGQVGLDREQEVGDEERRADDRRHQARDGEAAHEEERPERVDEVVDVEAEARPLVAAVAGERAVERVAEPVEDEPRVDGVKEPGVVRREGVGDAAGQERGEAEKREVVRRDGARHAGRHPQEQPLLDPAGQAQDPRGLAERRGRVGHGVSPPARMGWREVLAEPKESPRWTEGRACPRRRPSSSSPFQWMGSPPPRVARRGDVMVPPKAVDLLAVLLAQPGQVAPKEELALAGCGPPTPSSRR